MSLWRGRTPRQSRKRVQEGAHARADGKSPSIIMKRNTVERAAGLLVHSMREADTPIAELSDALARMARILNDPTVEVQKLRAELARNIAVCIESLQSYDRLMQQLAQARDILTGLAVSQPLEGVPGIPGNIGRIEGTIELF
jgi:hypothetical protein